MEENTSLELLFAKKLKYLSPYFQIPVKCVYALNQRPIGHYRTIGKF
jgi:hypothetical protein